MLVTLQQFLREAAGLRDHQRRTNVLPFFDRFLNLIRSDLDVDQSGDHLFSSNRTDLTAEDAEDFAEEQKEIFSLRPLRKPLLPLRFDHDLITHPESCPTSLRLRAALRDSIP